MAVDEPTEAELEAELLKLTRSRQSGTVVQARGAAIRTVLNRRRLEREAAEKATRKLQREQDEAAALQWPSPTPDAPAGDDFWPYCCTPAHHELESWRELDAAVPGTHGSRDHWRTQLEGRPPWKHPPDESG